MVHKRDNNIRKHTDFNLNMQMISAIDDIAIRSYYLHQLLEELIRKQEKGFFERIFLPCSIAASLITVFFYLQNPKLYINIAICYGIVIVVLVIGLVYERKRLARQDILEDEIYFYIQLDEVLKYTKQLELSLTLGSPDDALNRNFMEDTIDLLVSCAKSLQERIDYLKEANAYEETLKNIGRNPAYINQTFTQINKIVKDTKYSLGLAFNKISNTGGDMKKKRKKPMPKPRPRKPRPKPKKAKKKIKKKKKI